MKDARRRRLSAALLVVVTVALAACGTTVRETTTQTIASGGSVIGDDGLSAPVPGATGTTPTDTTLPNVPAGGPTGAVAPPAATTSTNAGSGPGTAPAGGPTSGPASHATTASHTASASASAASAIPATGKGWDAKYVYVGVITALDAANGLSALGVNLAPGDELGDANAVIAAVNKRGLLFGRQVKLIDQDNSTASVLANPDAVAQEDCTALTQDKSVIAVINTDASLDTDVLRGCFAQAHTPLVNVTTAPFDDQDTAKLAPYLYNALSVSYTRLTSVFVQHLVSQGYFTGWSATSGGPAPSAKPVVGILTHDDLSSQRVSAQLVAAVSALGYRTVTFQYANQETDMVGAVTRMETNGVTHLIAADSSLFFYRTVAQSQHFRPRLGLSTYNALQALLSTQDPASLAGAVGIGWNPSLDVNDAQDPGNVGPGEKQCLADLAAGGQTFSGKRFAEAVGFAICDGINLAVLGAQSGHGLDPASVRAGIVALGAHFPVAGSFGSGLSTTSFGLPGAARNIIWETGCGCFHYVGATFTL